MRIVTSGRVRAFSIRRSFVDRFGLRSTAV
jgi:hypothetical protein